MLTNDLNKPRILFRADGGSTIGLGHIYRCIALAERLSTKFDSIFATKQLPAHLVQIINKYSQWVLVNEYDDLTNEAKHLAKGIIKKNGVKFMVIDGYCFDTSYQQTIKDNCDVVLVAIDDDQSYHYVADIVINHAGADDLESKISRSEYTKLLLGYDHLLLRKQFISLLNKPKTIKKIRSLFVCFGGADPDDLTAKTLECLMHIQNIDKINVVIGSAYKNAGILRARYENNTKIKILSELNADEMSALMYKTDVAIVPASTVSLEAFAAKMIIITGINADNQVNIYNGLIKENTVTGIGYLEDLTCDKLKVIIQDIIIKYKHHQFIKGPYTSDPLIAIFEEYLK